MPTPTLMSLPKTKSPEEFEKICRDVLEVKYSKNFELYARKGQSQDGIDIASEQAFCDDGYVVAQCKNYLSEDNKSVFNNKIEGDLKKINKLGFPVSTIIIMTAIDRDKDIQEFVRTTWPDNTPIIMFWDDITELICANNSLLEKYYPSLNGNNHFPSMSYPDIPISLTTIPAAPKLIGREKDVQNIRDILTQKRIVSIHAVGGVGKTAIAAVITNGIINSSSPFMHVAWITSTGNLMNDLIGMDIPSIATAQSMKEKYKEACKYIQKHPTFLVIDNMDRIPTQGEIDELNTIAISGDTKILITTRANIPNVEEYELSDLNFDSALILFYLHFIRKIMTIDQIRDRDDSLCGEMIVKEAGCNALLIELIGKMAYADHWILKRLWERLNKDVFDLNSKYPIQSDHGDDGKLQEHIQKLYEMSTLSNKQKEIMSFLALFPPEHSIFFDVFKWAGFEDDEHDDLGTLQARGWIARDEEGYSIHTLIHRSIQLQTNKSAFEKEGYKNLIIELVNTDQYMPSDMVYTKVRERIVVTETICGLLTKDNSQEISTLMLYNNIARVYHDQGNYAKAHQYYEKALEIGEKVLGLNHQIIAIIYNGIGGVYHDQGNYEEAQKYFGKALEIQESVPGEKHLSTAKTYNNMAALCRDEGNYEKALQYYRKAFIIGEQVLGKKDSFVAQIYSNKSLVYVDEGKYEEALDCCQKALEIQESVLGEKHLSTAKTYNNMANAYRKKGNYEEAYKYFEKALEIYKQILGMNHSFTARACSNIGLVYSEQGNNEEALKHYRNALKASESVLGERHPFTAIVYNNIAEVYREQGNYEDALKFYSNALDVVKSVLGERHPFTAIVYNNIAFVYHDQGNDEEAMMYLGKALEIREQVLGVEHPDTASSYNNIGVQYYYRKDYEKAKDFFERAFVIGEKTLGADHPQTKGSKMDIETVEAILSKKMSHKSWYKMRLLWGRIIWILRNIRQKLGLE